MADCNASSGETRAPELERLQRWMFDVISHPEGVVVGAQAADAPERCLTRPGQLEDVVKRSKALTAEERVTIYANMYIWRLVDVLLEDFPLVQYLLGEDLFYDTCVAYLTAHPSTHYSLSHLGNHFSEFLLQEARDIPHREFVHELAVLEDAVSTVFDEPQAEQLTLEALAAISEDRWADARFHVIPAFQLYQFRYPVNDFVRARREDRHMDVPGPRDSWLAIFRKDYTVWRLPLSHERYLLLSALVDGEPLGVALERCIEGSDIEPEKLLGSMRTWFQDWTGEGLFARVELVLK